MTTFLSGPSVYMSSDLSKREGKRDLGFGPAVFAAASLSSRS